MVLFEVVEGGQFELDVVYVLDGLSKGTLKEGTKVGTALLFDSLLRLFRFLLVGCTVIEEIEGNGEDLGCVVGVVAFPGEDESVGGLVGKLPVAVLLAPSDLSGAPEVFDVGVNVRFEPLVGFDDAFEVVVEGVGGLKCHVESIAWREGADKLVDKWVYYVIFWSVL